LNSDPEFSEDGPDGPDSIDDVTDIEDLEDIADLDSDDGEDGEDVLDLEALEGDDVLDEDDDDAIDGTNGGDEVLDVIAVATVVAPHKVAAVVDGVAEAETDDDELLADEVEASLDVILAERLRGDDVEDEEPEDDEDDAPNQLATVIPVRQPDEFLCQSCFLLKPPGQLADADHQLCRDCA
jgi:hypothetical protein